MSEFKVLYYDDKHDFMLIKASNKVYFKLHGETKFNADLRDEKEMEWFKAKVNNYINRKRNERVDI